MRLFLPFGDELADKQQKPRKRKTDGKIQQPFRPVKERIDLVAEQQPDHARRDRCNDQHEQRPERFSEKRNNVAPENDDHGNERPEMHHDVDERHASAAQIIAKNLL